MRGVKVGGGSDINGFSKGCCEVGKNICVKVGGYNGVEWFWVKNYLDSYCIN